MSDDLCERFHGNPHINPNTGKPMIKGGAVYRSFVQLCGPPPVVSDVYTGPIRVSLPSVTPTLNRGRRLDNGSTFSSSTVTQQPSMFMKDGRSDVRSIKLPSIVMPQPTREFAVPVKPCDTSIPGTSSQIYFTHYSPNPLSYLYHRTYQQIVINGDPKGLRVYIGGELEHFITRGIAGNATYYEKLREARNMLGNCYDFSTDSSSLLSLRTFEDIINFTKRYTTTNGIKWPKVATHYDGILYHNVKSIKDRIDRDGQSDKFPWFMDQNVASGYVWNTKIITELYKCCL